MHPARYLIHNMHNSQDSGFQVGPSTVITEYHSVSNVSTRHLRILV
jgi:hypothetical protein